MAHTEPCVALGYIDLGFLLRTYAVPVVGLAVLVGLLPGLAGWGALLLKAGLRAGGAGTEARPFGSQLLLPLQQADVWAAGAFALEQGQIIAAMLLAAAALSWVGLMHAWRFTLADTVLQPGWGSGREWALGYLAMALVFLLGWRRGR